jgi:RNA polymerase sigma-70 factor (sigma-E family)
VALKAGMQRRLRGSPLIAHRQDEAEFREFAAGFSPTLVRAAYLLLGDRDAAEDAVQTVLLRTLRRWGAARSAPEAYSRRVLVNVCRDRWRDLRRHPVSALDDPGARELGVSPLDGVAQRLAVQEGLAALNSHQREVLVLRFFLDLSVAQTATLLEIPEGTVKSATSRGLAELRDLLTDQPEEVRHG